MTWKPVGLLTLLSAALMGAGMWNETANQAVTIHRLSLTIQHEFAGKSFVLNSASLRNRAGNLLSITRLSYLLSDFTLYDSAGQAIPLPESFGYIDLSEGRVSVDLGSAPGGNYVRLAFKVGVPPELNHQDPAQFAAGHALNPALNKLHWSWQGGYVFLALEGRYEQLGGKLGGYSYHIATDNHLMSVVVPIQLDLTQDQSLRLRMDLSRLFDGTPPLKIDSKLGTDSTHSAERDALAAQIARGVERAFVFGGINAPASNDSLTMSAPLPPGTSPYPFRAPSHFPRPSLPDDNPLTREGVALGKKLFFEKRLSKNNSLACAGCHHPDYAFSDPNKAFSLGITGQRGHRNAMPLFNLAWSGAYTWDGRREKLRDQALAPIQDPLEMNQSLPESVRKLKADATYPKLFQKAFGSLGITAERMGLALEQYLLTLIAADSKFDRALRGEAAFTDQEKEGLLLFITEYDPIRGKFGADCFHCHGGNLFTDHRYTNNGLDKRFRDEGRAQVTGEVGDQGKFKTPSLRNIAVTAPYMHDGRFKTLEQVIDHYSKGIHPSETLDPNIAKHPAAGIRLSAEDKRALVAFLKTLTDQTYEKSKKKL